MPESYVALPDETWHAAGDKFRAHQRTVGANVVQEPSFTPVGRPTYYLWAPAQACAANKYFLAYMNNAGSGHIHHVQKLFITNAQLAVIASGIAPATVGMLEIDVLRITAITGGTAITPSPVDTADGALANYTAVYSPTSCVDSTLVYPWYSNNDEVGVTGDISQATFQACISQMFEDNWADFKSFELQPGEGFAVKMITNFTLGQFAVLAVIGDEA